ncbi:24182_t:CDS:1 [Dentiscutata erythropus]|uniref:24182_t:CDS:1 n=1 Tax=Dentiscutata erythropus TaxID=1348616 RepID=A0A9N9N9J3_9GLOM|nr:24182_t:CDS:1 [Dentiscutata erythropus]
MFRSRYISFNPRKSYIRRRCYAFNTSSYNILNNYNGIAGKENLDGGMLNEENLDDDIFCEENSDDYMLSEENLDDDMLCEENLDDDILSNESSDKDVLSEENWDNDMSIEENSEESFDIGVLNEVDDISRESDSVFDEDSSDREIVNKPLNAEKIWRICSILQKHYRGINVLLD